MVALSQMVTFKAVEQKKFYGDIVTPSEVICENGGIGVITRDEKTAPPINARLQKGHCRTCVKPLFKSQSKTELEKVNNAHTVQFSAGFFANSRGFCTF